MIQQESVSGAVLTSTPHARQATTMTKEEFTQLTNDCYATQGLATMSDQEAEEAWQEWQQERERQGFNMTKDFFIQGMNDTYAEQGLPYPMSDQEAEEAWREWQQEQD